MKYKFKTDENIWEYKKRMLKQALSNLGIKDVKGRLLDAFVFSDRPSDSRKLIDVMIDENGEVTEINQEILE